MFNLKNLIMNRILFVGLCLVGMMVFVVAKTDTHIKKQPKTEIAKQGYKGVYY
jgi:hypothetical protein